MNHGRWPVRLFGGLRERLRRFAVLIGCLAILSHIFAPLAHAAAGSSNAANDPFATLIVCTDNGPMQIAAPDAAGARDTGPERSKSPAGPSFCPLCSHWSVATACAAIAFTLVFIEPPPSDFTVADHHNVVPEGSKHEPFGARAPPSLV